MGAGKSTIGEEAARLSGRPFVDLDREIERRHGPIRELFERSEPDFRQAEEQLAAEALSAAAPAVIALGGGAVLYLVSRSGKEPILAALAPERVSQIEPFFDGSRGWRTSSRSLCLQDSPGPQVVDPGVRRKSAYYRT